MKRIVFGIQALMYAGVGMLLSSPALAAITTTSGDGSSGGDLFEELNDWLEDDFIGAGFGWFMTLLAFIITVVSVLGSVNLRPVMFVVAFVLLVGWGPTLLSALYTAGLPVV